MNALLWLIGTLITIYIWLLIAQAVLSWLLAFGVINRYNRGVAVFGDFLYRITEPALRPIRAFLPNFGGVDISPIILILILFATCVLAGWGLRTYSAGILPALGWVIASFILAMPRPNGSVIIEASPAGEWYLYGGALAAAAGAAVTFYLWIRTRSRAT